MSDGPRPGETLDRLAGDWHILQLKRGHRFSTDDVVTAWRAARCQPTARRLLDIGCGIGSVGLSTLHLVNNPDATLVGIEAQQVSYDLACRSVQLNGLQDRVRLFNGDLRDPTVLPQGDAFDLITGSPPYIPVGKGVISPVPQRAGARMELRGSVFDYCAAARRWLAKNGRFCFVMAADDPRTEEAPVAAGLSVLERWDYTFRFGDAPRIATLVCARSEDGPFPARVTGGLTIRGADGAWTEDYLQFRQRMRLPVPPRHL